MDPVHRLVEAVLALDQFAAATAEAASRPRKPALTARSMPTVWIRGRRVPAPSSDRSWSSLPTCPSVTSTRTRSRSPSAQQRGRLPERREQFGAAPGGHSGQVLDGAEPVPIGAVGQTLRQPGRPFDDSVEGRARRIGRQPSTCRRSARPPAGPRPSSSRSCCRNGRARTRHPAVAARAASSGGSTVSSNVPLRPGRARPRRCGGTSASPYASLRMKSGPRARRA